MAKNRVPKQALDLVQRRQQEWRQSLPPILKFEVLKGIQKTKIKKQFLRSGVQWIWDKPAPISWSYYFPIPGRTTDRRPRIRAQRIAEAMQAMPDLIAEYREDKRQWGLQKVAEKKQQKEKERLVQAASTRLTDMRRLVQEFDALDDSFFDGDHNYYQLLQDKKTRQTHAQQQESAHVLAKATAQSVQETDVDDMDEQNEQEQQGVEVAEQDVNLERRRQKITQWRKIQNRRKQRSEKFAQMLKEKPLLSPELDTIQEKLDKSREWEKMDPEDGDYDDGRTWLSRRSEKELAYIQQLANEPNLEKEEKRHSKHRVK